MIKVLSPALLGKGLLENPASDIAVGDIDKVWYRTSHLDSTLFAVDKDGEVIAHMIYDPWGNPLVETYTDNNYSGLDNLNNFTGYTWDETLGLYFAQNRFYDAENHRFTQEDIIKDGANWYVYCGNNPLIYVDMLGLKLVVDEKGDIVAMPNGNVISQTSGKSPKPVEKKVKTEATNSPAPAATAVKPEPPRVKTEVKTPAPAATTTAATPVPQKTESKVISNIQSSIPTLSNGGYMELVKCEIYKKTVENTYRTIKWIQNVLAKIDITQSSGINLSGTLGGFSFNGQIGVSRDTKGNVALQLSFADGLTTGTPSASFTLYNSITNVPDLTSIREMSVQIGGTAGIPIEGFLLAVGGDVLIIPHYEDTDGDGIDEELQPYYGVTGNIGVGIPGGEVHVELAGTWTLKKINIFEMIDSIYAKIME